jgi:hypothetical protein
LTIKPRPALKPRLAWSSPIFLKQVSGHFNRVSVSRGPAILWARTSRRPTLVGQTGESDSQGCKSGMSGPGTKRTKLTPGREVRNGRLSRHLAYEDYRLLVRPGSFVGSKCPIHTCLAEPHSMHDQAPSCRPFSASSLAESFPGLEEACDRNGFHARVPEAPRCSPRRRCYASIL